jgi:hypothetical protein
MSDLDEQADGYYVLGLRAIQDFGVFWKRSLFAELELYVAGNFT